MKGILITIAAILLFALCLISFIAIGRSSDRGSGTWGGSGGGIDEVGGDGDGGDGDGGSGDGGGGDGGGGGSD
jgi:hypothetical protein